MGGFQGNIIQFGLDQLHDASTTEIKSFIIWYVITIIGAGFVVEFNFSCLNEQHRLFILLFICLSLSLALIALAYCNHWLIKEPATRSPLKLIYKVIKFAIVTKHPRCRSAFTYCEDELPSRIDFGKNKYGGPFTTEQVEDVKTFLRLIPLISLFGIIASLYVASVYLYIYLEKQYNRFKALDLENELDSTKVVKECYTETNVTCIVYVGVIFLMALHEFLLYPLFHRCIQCHTRIKSLWKVIVGTALLILKIITLAILDIISRHTILSYRGRNATLQCAFNRNPTGIPGKNLSIQWLAIPQYLYYTSLAFTLVGIIEFICSQVPYSMKGIVIGAQYTLALVCSVPMIGLVVLFKQLDLSTWGKGTIGCEFWYALTVVTVNLAIFFTLMWLAKRYKMRKRDDLLPNEHFFAERYYSS